MDFEKQHWYLSLKEELLRGRDGIVPFLGAGCSVDWGYPTWSSFLLQQARNHDLRVGKPILGDSYESLAEALFATRGPAFVDEIKNTFAIEPPRVERDTLLDAVLRLCDGTLVTTNYDFVIERRLQSSGYQMPIVIGSDSAHQNAEFVRWHRRVLIKLHGDARDDGSRILLKREYDQHYASSGPNRSHLVNLLRYIFRRRTCLFLGCSLLADRYLGVLETCIDEKDLGQHYAFVEEPDRSFKGSRQNFLLQRHIAPIWYARGKHEMVRDAILRLIESQAKPTATSSDRRDMKFTIDMSKPPIEVDLESILVQNGHSAGSDFDKLVAAFRANQTGIVLKLRGANLVIRASPRLAPLRGRSVSEVVLHSTSIGESTRFTYYPLTEIDELRFGLRVTSGNPAWIVLSSMSNPGQSVTLEVKLASAQGVS